MLRYLTVALAVVACSLLVACGDDDDEGGNGGSGGSTSTVDVSATDFKFDPANPTVDQGRVTFNLKNDGQAPHALEIEGPDGEAETEELKPGESASLEIELSEPGEYTMYCPVGNHRQMGMEGKVTVGEGGGETEKKEDRGGYGY